jgi:hypothetical protein
MILRTDCKYFPGDRPCTFTKTEGVVCDTCSHYQVNSFSILIIKLDAVGDVLRTTCILHGLKEKYPDSEITWVTRQSAVSLFEQYDLLIDLDAARDSAVLAARVQPKKKLGFDLDPKGHVRPFNKEAVEWLEMAAFDQRKKANTRSHQDLMLEICGLHPSRKDIALVLSDAEKRFAVDFAWKRRLTPRERSRLASTPERARGGSTNNGCRVDSCPPSSLS